MKSKKKIKRLMTGVKNRSRNNAQKIDLLDRNCHIIHSFHFE